MYQINFSHPVSVHFIGIGGISMSGLAAILLKEGFQVSGSDAKESDLTRWLESKGARIVYGQSASNIHSSLDVVVYTQPFTRTTRSLPLQKKPASPC